MKSYLAQTFFAFFWGGGEQLFLGDIKKGLREKKGEYQGPMNS